MNLKPLVNNLELYRSFLEYINTQIDSVHKHLEVEKDERVIYQLQGKIAILRKLLSLKERINDKSYG